MRLGALALLFLWAASCTSGRSGDGPAASTAPLADQGNPGDPAHGVEPTSGAQAFIEAPGAISIGTPFGVTVGVDTRDALTSARPRLNATGAGRIVGWDEPRWSPVGAGERRSATVLVVLDAYGESELQAFVDVVGSDPSVRYTESARRYFLATPQEVLTGTSGPLALRLEHLDHEHEARRLSDEQYRVARDDTLAGRQPR